MGGLATAWTTGNEGSSSTFMPTAKSALVGVLSNAIGDEGDGDGGETTWEWDTLWDSLGPIGSGLWPLWPM